MGGGLAAVAALFLLERSPGSHFRPGSPGAHLVMGGVLSVAMIAYRQILITAGHRSRQFRTAGGDRQRVYDLVIAAWLLMTIELVRGVSPNPDVRTIARVLTAVCACMIVIGLLYLLVNTTWVFRALIHPPPPLRQLIDTPVPDESE
jgi:hypothetical protein